MLALAGKAAALLLVVALVGLLQIGCRGPMSLTYGHVDVSHLPNSYPLAVEGEMVSIGRGNVTFQGRPIPFINYRMDIDSYWWGSGPSTLVFAVPTNIEDGIKVVSGQRYLVLDESSPVPPGGVWSGHRVLIDPQTVWLVDGDLLRPLAVDHQVMSKEEMRQTTSK